MASIKRAGSTGAIYKRIESIDFGIVPGPGVFEHPVGPRAGATTLLQGWEAFQKKVTLEEYSQNHPELKSAIASFGSRSHGK